MHVTFYTTEVVNQTFRQGSYRCGKYVIMDDDTQQLIAIQEELKGISDRLRKIFGQTHPQFDSVFEDIGAAFYYQRAGWLSLGISY